MLELFNLQSLFVVLLLRIASKAALNNYSVKANDTLCATGIMPLTTMRQLLA